MYYDNVYIHSVDYKGITRRFETDHAPDGIVHIASELLI